MKVLTTPKEQPPSFSALARAGSLGKEKENHVLTAPSKTTFPILSREVNLELMIAKGVKITMRRLIRL